MKTPLRPRTNLRTTTIDSRKARHRPPQIAAHPCIYIIILIRAPLSLSRRCLSLRRHRRHSLPPPLPPLPPPPPSLGGEQHKHTTTGVIISATITATIPIPVSSSTATAPTLAQVSILARRAGVAMILVYILEQITALSPRKLRLTATTTTTSHTPMTTFPLLQQPATTITTTTETAKTPTVPPIARIATTISEATILPLLVVN